MPRPRWVAFVSAVVLAAVLIGAETVRFGPTQNFLRTVQQPLSAVAYAALGIGVLRLLLPHTAAFAVVALLASTFGWGIYTNLRRFEHDNRASGWGLSRVSEHSLLDRARTSRVEWAKSTLALYLYLHRGCAIERLEYPEPDLFTRKYLVGVGCVTDHTVDQDYEVPISAAVADSLLESDHAEFKLRDTEPAVVVASNDPTLYRAYRVGQRWFVAPAEQVAALRMKNEGAK